MQRKDKKGKTILEERVDNLGHRLFVALCLALMFYFGCLFFVINYAQFLSLLRGAICP